MLVVPHFVVSVSRQPSQFGTRSFFIMVFVTKVLPVGATISRPVASQTVESENEMKVM